MRLFLDTNVLIDYFMGREPYRQLWVSLQAMQLFGDAELWTSAKSYTDVFYIGSKQVGGEELQSAFVESMEFLDICSVGPADIRQSAEMSWRDFEDCLISVCASKVKADYIVTRDASGFSSSSIPSIHPRNLIAHLAAEGYLYEEVEF